MYVMVDVFFVNIGTVVFQQSRIRHHFGDLFIGDAAVVDSASTENGFIASIVTQTMIALSILKTPFPNG